MHSLSRLCRGIPRIGLRDRNTNTPKLSLAPAYPYDIITRRPLTVDSEDYTELVTGNHTSEHIGRDTEE